MALQAPTITKKIPSSLGPSGNAGLRRPSDAFALKSSFFSPSIHLLLPPGAPVAATAPKFSMRVASKQAYICRDCGYTFSLIMIFLCSCSYVFGVNFCFMWCDAGIFTMTELPLRSCLTITSVLVHQLSQTQSEFSFYPPTFSFLSLSVGMCKCSSLKISFKLDLQLSSHKIFLCA